MVLNQLGKGTGPRVVNKGGQKVFIYDKEKYMAFILEKGIMFKAGKSRSETVESGWPEQVKSGELNPEGIGLNRKLYTAVMKKRDYDFYVFDKKKQRFYLLVDYGMLVDHARPVKIKRKTIVLTPFDAYTKIFDEHKLDNNLRKLKSSM